MVAKDGEAAAPRLREGLWRREKSSCAVRTLWVRAKPPVGVAARRWGWDGVILAGGVRASPASCCWSLLGNVKLHGVQMRVNWLKPDLKQKLQSCKEKPPSSLVPGGKCPEVPKPVPLSPVLCNAVERLHAVCRRQHLGTPLFLTKFVQANPKGWQRFWCQVVIPGFPVPFSGFTWVRQDRPGRSGHEEAKVAVALHVLRALGESSHGVGSKPLPFPSPGPGNAELRCFQCVGGPRMVTPRAQSSGWDSWLEAEEHGEGVLGRSTTQHVAFPPQQPAS